ncbi:hypothetical protein [Bradyrhizobium sp. ORS 111]|uniref:hypothetical protein n=1 Tax=Bradyrhizobium sp. ORS 111 TaxID=1685958 RepID=UPI0038901DEA
MRKTPASPHALNASLRQIRRVDSKKVAARFQNARFTTDRFKKIDNVELVIRKKLPSRFHRMQASDHAMIDDPHAARMPVFEWR